MEKTPVKTESPINCCEPGVLSFGGRFAASGTSAVTSDVNDAKAVAAYSATGKYTVTFPIYFSKVFDYRADLHVTTPAGVTIQVDSFTLNSSGVAVMTIGTYAVTTFAAADATGTITWECKVKR